MEELQAENQRLKSEYEKKSSELKILQDKENEVLRLDIQHLKSLYVEFVESRGELETTSAMQSSMFNQLRAKADVNQELNVVKAEITSLEKKASA